MCQFFPPEHYVENCKDNGIVPFGYVALNNDDFCFLWENFPDTKILIGRNGVPGNDNFLFETVGSRFDEFDTLGYIKLINYPDEWNCYLPETEYNKLFNKGNQMCKRVTLKNKQTGLEIKGELGGTFNNLRFIKIDGTKCSTTFNLHDGWDMIEDIVVPTKLGTVIKYHDGGFVLRQSGWCGLLGSSTQNNDFIGRILQNGAKIVFEGI